MEEKIDRQPPERLEDDVSILTANEQATAAQLRLMDPQLAGLYERGIRLMSQIHQPENVYLLAHCGRELSNGVLQLLLDEGGLPTSLQEDEQHGVGYRMARPGPVMSHGRVAVTGARPPR